MTYPSFCVGSDDLTMRLERFIGSPSRTQKSVSYPALTRKKLTPNSAFNYLKSPAVCCTIETSSSYEGVLPRVVYGVERLSVGLQATFNTHTAYFFMFELFR